MKTLAYFFLNLVLCCWSARLRVVVNVLLLQVYIGHQSAACLENARVPSTFIRSEKRFHTRKIRRFSQFY